MSKRLDVALVEQDPSRTRGYFQNLIKEGKVTVNDKVIIKGSHAVEPEDVLVVIYPPDIQMPEAENLPLDILYEGEQVLAINKPAGMIVHPNDETGSGTVVNALLHHFPEISKALYDPESAISHLRPGIVHRLDKDTSGVLLVAKSAESMQELATQFHDHIIEKQYLALVYGTVTESEKVETGMQRKTFRRNMMGVKELGEGRDAISRFEPLEQYTYFDQSLTLLQCQIETGRTHQIRVHCKFKGHPVLGDQVYTNKPATKLSERLEIGRQLLHASRITFTLPFSQESCSVEAPLPADFTAILDRCTRS